MKKILFLLTLLAKPAYSQIASESIACSTQDNSQKVYECAKENAQNSDNALNKEYSDLKRRIALNYESEPQLKEEFLAILNKSQINWIKLRDSNCRLESFEIETGTQAFETTVNNCIADESTKRTQYLKKIQPTLQ
ncbi:lysozyme inhibitor LprI family protein [Pseudomonas rhizoryzae]|uniref:lysozyme inhibitor LprI family protein n=1 Tax=Pseudomonas rhizoryzae TaxID=2571129 RepID=UPI00130521F0|nr:lysozyme inhibitor LprI family protein [Pseudomonas rhizoryzae]